MSYDLDLLDPVTKKTIEIADKHFMRGGTYALGGSPELSLNITYNYSPHFYKHIDPEKGIRFLYGKTGLECIPILEKAIAALSNDVDDDYWKPTEGNAKQALIALLTMSKMRPDGIWDGD